MPKSPPLFSPARARFWNSFFGPEFVVVVVCVLAQQFLWSGAHAIWGPPKVFKKPIEFYKFYFGPCGAQQNCHFHPTFLTPFGRCVFDASILCSNFWLKFVCANFDMFYQWILTFLFWLWFCNFSIWEISSMCCTRMAVRSKAIVAEMTMCVTFGAPLFGLQIGKIWRGSTYVTFYTISATAVRETAVCVTFGAPCFGPSMPSSWRPCWAILWSVRLGADFGPKRCRCCSFSWLRRRLS